MLSLFPNSHDWVGLLKRYILQPCETCGFFNTKIKLDTTMYKAMFRYFRCFHVRISNGSFSLADSGPSPVPLEPLPRVNSNSATCESHRLPMGTWFDSERARKPKGTMEGKQKKQPAGSGQTKKQRQVQGKQKNNHRFRVGTPKLPQKRSEKRPKSFDSGQGPAQRKAREVFQEVGALSLTFRPGRFWFRNFFRF